MNVPCDSLINVYIVPLTHLVNGKKRGSALAPKYASIAYCEYVLQSQAKIFCRVVNYLKKQKRILVHWGFWYFVFVVNV